MRVVVVGDPEGPRHPWVAQVDRGQRPEGEGADVVGVAVGREAALVPEQTQRGARHQDRLATVLADVEDVQDARLRRRVAHGGNEQATLLVQAHRLVRRLERRGAQHVGDDRVGRVLHVQHVGAGAGGALVGDAGRPEQRRVVVGALVALRVDVALDAVAAALAGVADLDGVAGVALLVPAAGDVGGGRAALGLLRQRALGAGRARGRRCGRRRRGGRGEGGAAHGDDGRAGGQQAERGLAHEEGLPDSAAGRGST